MGNTKAEKGAKFTWKVKVVRSPYLGVPKAVI